MTNWIGQTLGRYQVQELLGEGGMATVYRALDTRLGRVVALKVIRSAADAATLRRFELEARALAQLSHPAVVRVLDYGEQDGQPYLVLEYVPAGTLKDRLAAGRPLDERASAAFLAPVARALAAAHRLGIIHRDVKPGNILITEAGQPMLSDFGIAKTLQSDASGELTGAGIRIGTPDYMSPEQCAGAPVDFRTDIYALGVVFYEMLTARKPFSAETPMATMHRQIYDPLPAPRAFSPGISRAALALLQRALAKDPAARFPSMEAMAEALEAVAAGQPVVASVPPPVAAIETAPRPAPRPRQSHRRFPFRMLRMRSILGWLAVLALLVVGVTALVRAARPLLDRLPALPGAAPAATRAPAGKPTARPTADGPVSNAWKQGRMAFVQRDQNFNHLYLLDPASGEVTTLFDHPGKQTFGPAWSPDGSRLTYYIYPEDLRVQDPADPDSAQNIGRCNVPSWSPDGARIICRDANRARLLIYDAAGGGQLGALDLAGAAVPAWNPAREDEVAVAVFQNGNTSIWTIDLKSGQGTALAGEGSENYAPAWSPDGERIAFQSNAGSDASEIWVMNRDGSGAQRITTTPGGAWSRAPAWSPDGEWLAFVSSQAGSIGPDYGEIFVVNLATGQVQQVTNTGGIVYDWRVAWK